MSEQSKISLIYEKLILGRKERVTISNTPIEKIEDTTNSLDKNVKPKGLWYGFGDNWINFAKREMGDDYFPKKKHGYKVYINKSKVLSLNNDKELQNFVETYKTKNWNSTYGYEELGIDWAKVGQKYSGIEMPKFEELNWRLSYERYGNYYRFLHAWDISSGCIWKPDGIVRLHHL